MKRITSRSTSQPLFREVIHKMSHQLEAMKSEATYLVRHLNSFTAFFNDNHDIIVGLRNDLIGAFGLNTALVSADPLATPVRYLLLGRIQSSVLLLIQCIDMLPATLAPSYAAIRVRVDTFRTTTLPAIAATVAVTAGDTPPI